MELPATASYLGARLPPTAGHKIAGWVDEVGSEVSGIAPGDAVAVYELIGCGRCRACLGERTSSARYTAEFTRDGGLTDYVAIPSSDVLPSAHLQSPFVGSVIAFPNERAHAVIHRELQVESIADG